MYTVKVCQKTNATNVFTGAYKTHLFSVKVDLGPQDVIPDNLDKFCYVEYNMPNSTVSRAQVRSISVNPVEDENPDKWVHHLAKYEYKVAVEFSDKPPKPPVPEVTLPENCIAPIEVANTETVVEKPEAEESDSSDSSDSD
ncbi:hypothetical protein LSH36_635g00013 [Paralvinella palmiformis]|uniref:Uncharacterized protein n=1 Tax=Paralvinella palmiformis TaxID=53620 RepID=A0AAD9J470_9ANNE|nr:hypothetical protein LSH36_635g00013 [Paralvinella palmiformis]